MELKEVTEQLQAWAPRIAILHIPSALRIGTTEPMCELQHPLDGASADDQKCSC